jgi:hypothetical protein
MGVLRETAKRGHRSETLRRRRRFVSRDARADLEFIFGQLEAASRDRLLVMYYPLPEIHPARVVRVIIPGLETINPFFVGVRARSALLRDLLPAGGQERGRGVRWPAALMSGG